MGGSVTIFSMIVAGIIVVTKLVLNVMEERDRNKGMAINPEEYKMSGLLKIMWKERKEKIKTFFAERKAKRNAKRQK